MSRLTKFFLCKTAFLSLGLSYLLPDSSAWADIENLKEHMIHASEKKALNQVNYLLKKHKGSSLEPELLVRKATLFQRLGQSARYFEFRREESNAPSLLPRKILKASARQQLKNAVDTFNQVLKNFTDYVRNDEVLFNIAFLQQELGNPDLAKRGFLALCDKYPRSHLIGDAYLAAGEISFEEKNFVQARELYNKVPPSDVNFNSLYARYKTGWSFYNEQKNQIALTALEKLLSLPPQDSNNSAHAFDFRTDVLKDTVLFFADVHPWQKAPDYFKIFTSSPQKHIYRLGQIYQYRSEYQKMAGLYLKFLNAYSDKKFTARIFKILISYFNKKKNYDKVISLIQRMQKDCHRICKKEFYMLSQVYATEWHKKWRTTKNHQFIKNSIKVYNIYLAHKEPGPTKEKTRYQLAEALFESGRFFTASLEYEKVAKVIADPVLAHDAPYAAIVSFELALKNKSWSADNVARFDRLVDIYADKNPQGKYKIDLQFKQATLALERKDLILAKSLFLEIGSQKISKKHFLNQSKIEDKIDKKTIEAQDQYLLILDQTKEFNLLAMQAKKWHLQATPKRALKLKKIADEAEFAVIGELANSGLHSEADKLYKNFIVNSTSPELKEKAWWNRVQILTKMNDSKKAAQVSMNFQQTFPQSKWAKEALGLAAGHFEKMAMLQEAAIALKRLAVLQKNQAKTKSLRTAAQFYQILGLDKEAQVLYEMALKNLPLTQSTQRIQISRLLIAVSEDRKKVLNLLRDSSPSEIAGLFYLEMAKEQYTQKQWPQAFRSASRALAQLEKSSEKAESRWIQAQILDFEFRNQSLRSKKMERLPLVIAIKTEKLDKAQKAYHSTIHYGDAELTAKSYLALAKLYSQFVKDLNNFIPPQELSESDKETLKTQISAMVAPLEDQAADTLSQAIKFIDQNLIFSDTVSEVQMEFDRINMRSTKPLLNTELIQPLAMLPISRRARK